MTSVNRQLSLDAGRKACFSEPMTSTATSARAGQAAPPRVLRMRDLTKEAGLSRQAIHAYIAEGLLPPPVSAGRNNAIYSDEHRERLQWIQKLQREHFLSLNAIKAVLNGGDVEAFSPEQRQLLRRVRDQLPGWARPAGRSQVRIAKLLSDYLSEGELLELANSGLIDIRGVGADRMISQEDSEIVDCFVRYKLAGATSERGYEPGHLVTVNNAIEQLVQILARLYANKWSNSPVDEAVAFVEAVIPIDERLMSVLFRKKIGELIGRA
jgi:DNA-binding transcriptional MerR regulator